MHASTIETVALKPPPIRTPRPARHAPKLLSGTAMRVLWEAYQRARRAWLAACALHDDTHQKAATLCRPYPDEAKLMRVKYRNGKPVPVAKGSNSFQSELTPATIYELRDALKRERRLLSTPERIGHYEAKIAAYLKWDRHVRRVQAKHGLPALKKAVDAAELAYEAGLEAVIKARTASPEGIYYKLLIANEMEDFKSRLSGGCNDTTSRVVLGAIRDLGAAVGIPTSRAAARH